MLPAPRCASRWAGKSPISGSSTNRRSVAASIRCALTAVWISRSTQLERLADPFVIGCRHVVRSLDRRAPCSPLVRALGASSRDPANREEKEVVRLHGDGFGVAPALPGASWSTSGRRRMFDVFGNGGVQPPHSLHKRALAGNSSARRAPHLAHHAAAVGRICGPPRPFRLRRCHVLFHGRQASVRTRRAATRWPAGDLRRVQRVENRLVVLVHQDLGADCRRSWPIQAHSGRSRKRVD